LRFKFIPIPVRINDQIIADRIINGLIFDIKHFALHDGPGIRTTVFFKGCPLNCWWCQNPESRGSEIEELTINDSSRNRNASISVPETVGRMVSVSGIMEEVEKDRIFYDQSGGGITISGGEPLLQPDFLIELLTACRKEEITTAIDTSGFAEIEILERLFGLVDYYLYDLKLMDEDLHRKNTGVSNQSIIHNLAWLAAEGEKVIVRVPLIPDITDTKENLKAIAHFVKSLESDITVDLLPFNLLAKDKFHRFKLPNKLMKMQTQAPEQIDRMVDYFQTLGIPVTIGG